MDLTGFGLSKTHSLTVERVLGTQAFHGAAADKPVLVNDVPQMKPDSKQKQTAVQFASKIYRDRPEDGTNAWRASLESRRRVQSELVAKEAACALVDDAGDLTDLADSTQNLA
jgi:hypothetical protein